MVQLPLDVWLHIIEFIPQTTLISMLAVNKLFFEIAMENKYRVVSLTQPLSHSLMVLVGRLTDPQVGKWVRSLQLRLQDVKDYGKRSEPPASLRHRILSAFPAGMKFLSTSSSPNSQKHTPQPAFEVFIHGLMTAFPMLVNLREFSIDSWDLPPSFDLHPFFVAAWSSFGPNLTKVSFGGNLEGFRVLVNSNPPFTSVKDLSLEFTNNLFRVDDAADQRILTEVMAPFVNSLARALDSCKVWSWASLDLSAFFIAIGPFPNLTRLSARTPFNRSFRDPSGLRNLLETSPHLRIVELRLNPAGSAVDASPEQVLGEWLLQTATDPRVFANLTELQIYPTSFPPGLDALTTGLQRSASSLQRLVVRDRYLHYEEIEVVTRELSRYSALKFLRLNIWRLTIELLDLLANRFPGLRGLGLFVADAVIGEPASTMESFKSGVMTRSYADWKLDDIGIWQGGFGVDMDVMTALGRQIPSVRSFWGGLFEVSY